MCIRDRCKHILAVTAESADSGAAAALGVDGSRGATACRDREADAPETRSVREEEGRGGPRRPGPPAQAARDGVNGVQQQEQNSSRSRNNPRTSHPCRTPATTRWILTAPSSCTRSTRSARRPAGTAATRS